MLTVRASAVGLLMISIAFLGALGTPNASIAGGAGTFTVTKTDDTADGACDADCSLREAIIAANARSGTDTIILGAGTYNLSILGTGENAAATGDLDVTESLTIDGVSYTQTIIDGDGNDTVFDLKENTAVRIQDVTVRGGGDVNSGVEGTGGIFSRANLVLERVVVTGNTWGGPDSTGGITSRGQLTIINSVIASNSAPGNGSAGGIFADGVTAIYNSTIFNNTALGGGIGGLWFAGPTLTIDGSTFSDNEGANNGAGGLYAFEGTTTINRSTFFSNAADDGIGGVWIEDGQAATITDSDIVANEAFGSESIGGLFLQGTASTVRRTEVSDNETTGPGSVAGLMTQDNDVAITDTSITNNRSSGQGSTAGVYTFESIVTMDRVDIYENSATGQFGVGGMFADGEPLTAAAQPAGISSFDITVHDSEITENAGEIGGLGVGDATVKLDRVTVSGNTAGVFGGIWVDAYLSAINTTISNNSAAADGVAGIYIRPGAATLLQSVTVADNFAGAGPNAAGGIWNDGNANLIGTLFAYNSPQNCVIGSGDSFSSGLNLETTNNCNFNHATDKTNTDPQLQELADNGGWVPTNALPAGSSAIDIGDCDFDVDARQTTRPSGFCDAGAYEYNGAPAAITLPWGDLNCSFLPDMLDAILVVAHGAGLETDSGHCPDLGDTVDVAGSSPHPWGDVNCDDAVNGTDAIAILSYYSGGADVPTGSCPDVGDTATVTPAG